jgi:hypothetical protein
VPWAGSGRGEENRADFVDLARFWEKIDFRAEALFGSGEYAAMFRRFTYRSRVVGKLVTTPFAIFARQRPVHLPATYGGYFCDRRLRPQRRRLDLA